MEAGVSPAAFPATPARSGLVGALLGAAQAAQRTFTSSMVAPPGAKSWEHPHPADVQAGNLAAHIAGVHAIQQLVGVQPHERGQCQGSCEAHAVTTQNAPQARPAEQTSAGMRLLELKLQAPQPGAQQIPMA